MSKKFKIIICYLLGFLCLGLFFDMDNSEDMTEFLWKADRYRTDWGFAFYAVVGLIKMLSLAAGVTIPLILSFMLIRHLRDKTCDL